MQCEKCKYVLDPFDDVCPRCGVDTSKQLADASFFDDGIAVRKTTPRQLPATYSFPTDGYAMVTKDGIQHGPFTLAEINSNIKSGNLALSDTVMTGSHEWVALKSVQGIIVPPPTAVSPRSGPLEYPFPASYEGNIPYSEILSDNTEDVGRKGINKSAVALGILAFLFPILGLITWLILKNKKSPLAEKVGQWTYYGVIFNLTFFASIDYFEWLKGATRLT